MERRWDRGQSSAHEIFTQRINFTVRYLGLAPSQSADTDALDSNTAISIAVVPLMLLSEPRHTALRGPPAIAPVHSWHQQTCRATR